MKNMDILMLFIKAAIERLFLLILTKIIITLLCFLCSPFENAYNLIYLEPPLRVLRPSFYKIDNYSNNSSPDTTYSVQNTSFSACIYMLIFQAPCSIPLRCMFKTSNPHTISSSSTWI